MTINLSTVQSVSVSKPPDIPGLRFRGYRGEADHPAMSAVICGSKDADGLESTQTPEEVDCAYRHLVNSDPRRDMLFAEVDGEVVGYSRVWWNLDKTGIRLYQHFVHLLPVWRTDGLRQMMLGHNERRLREIAAGHPDDGPRFFEAWAADTESHWVSVLEGAEYKAVRHGYSMVRPDLENIPDLPLPEGLEVRSIEPELVPVVWAAAREGFRDEWSYSEDEWSDDKLREFQEWPAYDPGLWQVAWDGDQVAGMVLNFVDRAENEEYGRQRGYTEGICVRRPWRRRGLAKALIARSFRMHRELGMTEAALGVDAENPNGALQLYKSMGFQVVKRYTTYRKPLE